MNIHTPEGFREIFAWEASVAGPNKQLMISRQILSVCNSMKELQPVLLKTEGFIFAEKLTYELFGNFGP